jgi:hypothetical protein
VSTREYHLIWIGFIRELTGTIRLAIDSLEQIRPHFLMGASAAGEGQEEPGVAVYIKKRTKKENLSLICI